MPGGGGGRPSPGEAPKRAAAAAAPAASPDAEAPAPAAAGGGGLRVARPELPPFTPWSEEARASFKKNVADFEDTQISNASAPFVSFRPFTCAFGRPFFQGGLLLLAGNCMILVLCLVLPFAFLDTILGRRKLFLTRLALEQHAGFMSVIVVLIVTSVVMARRGHHPGTALKVFGMCPFLVCISYGILVVISIAESDVFLAIFWICWIVAASFIGYTTLINERAWFMSFCAMGAFSIPASLAIFLDRLALMALVFSCFGFLFSGMAAVARVTLKRTLAKAIEATSPDRERYEAVWAGLLSREGEELGRLAKYAQEQEEHAGHKFVQPSDDVEVIDLIRASVVVDTIAEVLTVLELVMNDCRVHIVKNRLDPAYDAKETFGYRDLNLQISFPETRGTAYGDFVFELQIHVKEIIAQKHNDGHRRYIEVRNLMGS